MNVKLDIPVGHYRNLTNQELNEIERSVEESAKTPDDQ
jgi:hypothetical protein